MNEDQLQIDVQAEQQLLSTSIITNPSDLSVQKTENIVPSFNLPESLKISEQIQPTVELPESILLESTKVNFADAPLAEVSSVAIGLNVKFDAESSYNQLSKKVDAMEEGFETSLNQNLDRWIPYPKAQNKFEEKPTTDPTNLVFDDRMFKFSSIPAWA